MAGVIESVRMGVNESGRVPLMEKARKREIERERTQESFNEVDVKIGNFVGFFGVPISVERKKLMHFIGLFFFATREWI